MRDTEFYGTILGLASPWTVTNVELSMKNQRVDVWAGHKDGILWTCPTCGRELTL